MICLIIFKGFLDSVIGLPITRRLAPKLIAFLGEINTTLSDSLEGSFINDYIMPLENIKAQYIKLKAINYGFCPDWHLGAGGKTWLFVDEIIIH